MEDKIVREAKTGAIIIIHGYLGHFNKLTPATMQLPVLWNETKLFIK